MTILYEQNELKIAASPVFSKIRFTVVYEQMHFEVAFQPMAIDRELVNQWIIALRSGEYNQGSHFLYSPTNEKYCCLGVLAKVCQLPLRQYSSIALLNNEWFMEHSFKTNISEPGDRDLQLLFSRMNDVFVPFAIIATVIEQLATLFPLN